jgi:hypothetical protein
VGAADVQINSSSPTSTQYVPGTYAANLDAIVKAAKAAGIKVILGTTPGTGSGYDFALPYVNSIIAAYGAENNIEVVNYADALCQCVGALGTLTDTPNNLQQPVYTVPGFPSTNPGPYLPTLLPTTAGYAVMTQLAETAVANEYLTLKSGYLSNVITQSDDNIGVTAGQTNLNTVQPEAVLQFIPIGVYSDGSVHSQTNTLWDGLNGTWTSSNPLVMSVNQQGLALATTTGTATIKYTQPNGVDFHSWVMYVQYTQ